MKIIKITITAALIVGLLSATALAVTAGPRAHAPDPLATLTAPVKIVQPIGLSREFENFTIQLTFTIDETGTPRDIVPDKPLPAELSARLLPAFSQWKFSPVFRDGVAVPTRVALPLKLVAER